MAANNVYRTLADCANRDGNELFKGKNFDDAVARARDAEQFSEHLNEGKREALQESTSLLVSALSASHLYEEAVDAQQHWIDFLKTSADEYDQAFVQAYMSLQGIYADAKDWHGVEQALVQTIEACDRIHSHFTAENNAPFIDPTVPRNWSQYNLVIANYQEGNTDTALSKAEDFFTEYSQKQQDTAHPLSVAYHASDFAALALQIATEAKRQDDIDLWQKRAPGGIQIIALHPVGTH